MIPSAIWGMAFHYPRQSITRHSIYIFPYKYTFPCTYIITSNLLPRKMVQIECSETSAIINQTPGNHPKEDILYSKHGESLKSRTILFTCWIQFLLYSSSLSKICVIFNSVVIDVFVL
jgi:hypothetical protein